MSAGRPRDHGTDEWMTVREAADALRVTQQAIRNRIKAGTLDYDLQVEEGATKPSYRIRRAPIEAEAERKKDHTTQGDLLRMEDHSEARTESVLEAFDAGIERIAKAIENQEGELTELAEALREELVRLSGQLEAIQHNQREVFEEARKSEARVQEAVRVEKEYQQQSLHNQRESLRLFQSLKDEADRMRAEREAIQTPERRSIWRRIFGS